MKKITTIFTALLLLTAAAQATIRTVSNFPANLAQFNDIQAAVDASAAGDTILVHGSPTVYAGFVINKKLTIIGPGFSPNKQLPFTASVGRVYLVAGAADSEIQGLTFNSVAVYVLDASVNNVRIIRNQFNSGIFESTVNGSGYLFEGNSCNSSGVLLNPSRIYSNIIIRNNLFRDEIANFTFSGFLNCTNVLIDHNLFFGTSVHPTFNQVVRGISRFVTITNNIFIKSDPSEVQSSTFNNNITFNSGNNAPWNVNSNMNAGGNVENQDPQMADQAIVNAGTNNPIANFTIAAGPANDTGSDGKDIGLLYDITGALNWTNSRMPRVPFITIMNVTTPTVAAGSTLQVNIEARTNN